MTAHAEFSVTTRTFAQPVVSTFVPIFLPETGWRSE